MPPELTLLTSAPETKFEFYSASLLKASTTPEGRKMLHGVASSTTKDLHGDTILRSALEDMERTAVGMTIFLNHSYAVPADVAGTVTKAIIKQDGVDQNHDPNYSLLFDIEVEDDNPEALRSWRYIQKGRKLGLSIGAMIPDGGAKRQKDGSYLIEHVNLLETSIVGIPANPKSWVEYAASALRGLAAKSKQTTNLGNPTLTLDADKGVYRIEGSLDGVQLGANPELTATPTIEHTFTLDADGKVEITRSWQEAGSGNETTTLLGAWNLSDPDETAAAMATAGTDVVHKATVWVETRDGDKITIGEPVDDGTDSATNSTDPAVTTSGDDVVDPTAVDAGPDPDVTDAKVRIIEVDTDDTTSSDGGSSQGASDSEPDDDTYAAPSPDVTTSATPEDLEGLPADELLRLSHEQLRVTALSLSEALIETRGQLAEVTRDRDAAIQQRDALAEEAGELVRRTAETIRKVGDITLLPKARMAAAEQSFAGVEAFYGERFTTALRGS
jgi:phage head maturation protease